MWYYRYPGSRTVDTQYRQTAPTVGFNLLTSMTSDNGVKQVFEGGDTKSVTPLHQGRRADERLPVVIGEDQMPMVTYRLNRSVRMLAHSGPLRLFRSLRAPSPVPLAFLTTDANTGLWIPSCCPVR